MKIYLKREGAMSGFVALSYLRAYNGDIMENAIEFLIWEISKDKELKNYLLKEISKKTRTINTNTSDIEVSYENKTVELYNAAESAKNYIQKFSLDEFIEHINQ